MIEKLARKNILALKPYTSARDMYSEGILLDANENSLGTTSELYGDLCLNRYPDPHQEDLKKAAGEYFGIEGKNLFFGVGSDEVIDLLIRVFCEPREDSAMILDPTYGMYQVACDINNVKTKVVNLKEDFQIDLEAVKKNFDSTVKIIFLCSPNNPTGNLLKKDDILELCRTYNAIIAVDEAYVDFAGDNSLIKEVNEIENLAIIRTFSKAWGLAGIRLGFCAANEELIRLLFKVKAPYNVSSLTRKAVINAIGNKKKKDEFVQKLISERERVKEELSKIPGILKVYSSDANYLLFKCSNARLIQKKMAEEGVIIRDRSSYEMLRDCLRVSIGTEYENNRFLEAIKKFL
ncbi:MAG: histidinol-phosphate transaminase [Ignavibacteria bacterium]|jgi:histidinol-phosphate aminotransferase|nr:histidinol-phosphate transaminase [Ignavibacteria bacterium]MCU7502016.1 histidinol-phosphate transaminase [Ignavibacteria bacterium]MCU7516984.1 histidinol-phosphate transaminase [Ignavibacteria bacterium]